MKKHIILGVAVILACLGMNAQTSAEAGDSLKAQQDSIIHSLQNRLQEMQLQHIMMQEALERTGKSARLDSIAQAQRRHRIDSLRKVTKGSPLVVEGDTLFTLYAAKGGLHADARVRETFEIIDDLGHRLTLKNDTVSVVNGEYFSDVMMGDEVILSLTDLDALWQDTKRESLAKQYGQAIQQKISEMQEEYGARKKLIGIALLVFIIVLQIFLIKLTNKLYRRYKFKLTRWGIGKFDRLNIKDIDFFNPHRQAVIFLTLYNTARVVLITLQLLISIPLLFSIFPETEKFTYTIFGYIWDTFRDFMASFVAFLPNLLKIIVIFICIRLIVRGIRYFANEVEAERVKINGFYPDWAKPTFLILRVLLYSLMLVMIWPLLPNHDSKIFQGVSVFIGIVVSLGSTSIIGNTMAGLVLTYMRPFHIGDYIKVGETEGEVIEKTTLVTRIRTRKNEVVTIQNSNLLGSQTSNFTVAARNYGLIVHTKVTIGYDVPWQKVKDIMESAALETKGIKRQPRPFLRITSLDDSFVEYEINGFTNNATELPRIYSELHQNLLRRFFEEGVEIMSPHIYARRDGIDTQIPTEYLK